MDSPKFGWSYLIKNDLVETERSIYYLMSDFIVISILRRKETNSKNLNVFGMFTWIFGTWSGDPEFLILVWGGRSTLAGRMFTTDFKNKNLSCHQKTLEKAVPLCFFSSVIVSPIKSAMTNPNWKFFRFTVHGFLDYTELLVYTVVLTEPKVGAYWNLRPVWHVKRLTCWIIIYSSIINNVQL